jgi:hypothetical protein
MGFLLSSYLSARRSKKERDEYINLVNSVFDDILDDIKNSTFLNRINNTVTLNAYYGGEVVTVMYMIDKKDIAVFKDERCIYTSESVDASIVNQLVNAIEYYHRGKINDVINVMGFMFSREYFETAFKIKADDLKRGVYGPQEVSEVDKIKGDNNAKLDIDEVLDRILEVGVDKLSVEEYKFLKDYNKKNPS